MEQQKLPNATAVLVLGILSIIGCCCYGVIGLVLGIVALVLAKKDMAEYRANPELYSNYSSLNTGRILAIIGLVVSAINFIAIVVMVSMYGFEGMQQMNQQMLLDLQNH